jgi:hypothetical protein
MKGYFMMIRSTKVMMIMVLIPMMSLIIDIHGCFTTFINDKGIKILIYDKNDELIIPIAKNEKRRFGSEHDHAHFVIYTQEPKKRLFSPLYTCKQNQCGGNGNMQLKFSDIENDTDAAALFTITEHAPHMSMVQRVSEVIKSECTNCEKEE